MSWSTASICISQISLTCWEKDDNKTKFLLEGFLWGMSIWMLYCTFFRRWLSSDIAVSILLKNLSKIRDDQLRSTKPWRSTLSTWPGTWNTHTIFKQLVFLKYLKLTHKVFVELYIETWTMHLHFLFLKTSDCRKLEESSSRAPHSCSGKSEMSSVHKMKGTIHKLLTILPSIQSTIIALNSAITNMNSA